MKLQATLEQFEVMKDTGAVFTPEEALGFTALLGLRFVPLQVLGCSAGFVAAEMVTPLTEGGMASIVR